MRSIVIAAAADPELQSMFRTDVTAWRKEEMDIVLARGIERGEVRPDAPADVIRELANSVLWHRLLITGDPIDDDLVMRLVDEVLMPLVSTLTADSVATEENRGYYDV